MPIECQKNRRNKEQEPCDYFVAVFLPWNDSFQWNVTKNHTEHSTRPVRIAVMCESLVYLLNLLFSTAHLADIISEFYLFNFYICIVFIWFLLKGKEKKYSLRIYKLEIKKYVRRLLYDINSEAHA